MASGGRNKNPPSEGGVGSEMKSRRKSLLCLDLCLGDFAALDATGADAQLFGLAVYQRLDCLQIHVPGPPRDVVGVRDIIAKPRAFPADIAYLCHDLAPNSNVSRSPYKGRHTSTLAYRIFIITGTGSRANPRVVYGE